MSRLGRDVIHLGPVGPGLDQQIAALGRYRHGPAVDGEVVGHDRGQRVGGVEDGQAAPGRSRVDALPREGQAVGEASDIDRGFDLWPARVGEVGYQQATAALGGIESIARDPRVIGIGSSVDLADPGRMTGVGDAEHLHPVGAVGEDGIVAHHADILGIAGRIVGPDECRRRRLGDVEYLQASTTAGGIQVAGAISEQAVDGIRQDRARAYRRRRCRIGDIQGLDVKPQAQVERLALNRQRFRLPAHLPS